MLSAKGNATQVMFNSIIDETLERVEQWFDEHQNEPYCYWAKDEFISIADKNNQFILDKHPEIEDINDHTVVQWNEEAKVMRLSRFCPNLKAGIADMFENGAIHGHGKTCNWAIFKDKDNYELIGYKE